MANINSVKKELPRSTPLVQESITATELHAFATSSIVASCATVYAVVYQPNSVSQGLVTSKSQIYKYNITIPRLELVSTHIGANLIQNVNQH